MSNRFNKCSDVVMVKKTIFVVSQKRKKLYERDTTVAQIYDGNPPNKLQRM